jgi:hypothetical protein
VNQYYSVDSAFNQANSAFNDAAHEYYHGSGDEARPIIDSISRATAENVLGAGAGAGLGPLDKPDLEVPSAYVAPPHTATTLPPRTIPNQHIDATATRGSDAGGGGGSGKEKEFARSYLDLVFHGT